MSDVKDSAGDSAEEPGGEEQIASERFTSQGRPVKNKEVADFGIRTVRTSTGGTMRTYLDLTPEREATEDDFLGVRDTEEWEPSPAHLARNFDDEMMRFIGFLSLANEDRESSREKVDNLSGTGSFEYPHSFTNLAPEFQTEERRRRLEEARWLAEHQPYGTRDEARQAFRSHHQQIKRLRNAGQHEEANALVDEWARLNKLLWPELTAEELKEKEERARPLEGPSFGW